MKRLFLAAAVLLFPVLSLDAQTPDTLAVSPVDTTVTADSLTVVSYMSYDSLMTYLSGHVSLSDSLIKAMDGQVDRNRGRAAQGYRIRIYFDNSQNARTVSEQIVDTFKVHHPDVPVFRIYDNPYFKVTVGEFRTKSDAMRFLEAIRPEYPTVFLVKESFSTI